MIDWHSHILPGIDDGSKDVAESVSMLQMLAAQGVDTVVATPHFYANYGTVATFLEKREAAYQQLKAQLPADAPEILLGAEVRYYPGISRMDGLKALRIQGTTILLLEMPFTRWTEFTIRELIELSGMHGFQIVMAHVERYLPLQTRVCWDRLLQCDILFQVNAGCVTTFGTRRRVRTLLKNGNVHLLGSDCHNMHTRKPNMEGALAWIEKEFGSNYLCQMNELGNTLLGTK